jgi:replicative DNA helicase
VPSDLRECVTGETLVALGDGRRVPIRELVGTTPEVVAVDERHRLVNAFSDMVWPVGVRPVFRLELASGRSLRATADHRVLAGAGFKRLSQLSVADRVAIARDDPQPDQPRVRPWERGHRAHAPEAQHGRVLLQEAFSQSAAGEVLWDRIVSLEPDGAEQVYDLTVPGPSCWLSNEIVSHNSGSLEQDADLVMFIYREEYYDRESERPGEADIIVAKHRNGPVGEVVLTFQKEFPRFMNYAGERFE